MNDQHRTLLKIHGWAAIILFVLRCAISFEEIKTSFSAYGIFGYAGEALGCSTVFILLYERWIWRLIPQSKVPKLKKKYKGELTSTFDNKKRPVVLKIRQSYSTIHITLISGESKSNSLTATICDINGEPSLIYNYMNTPKATYRSNSPIHYGTAVLSLANVKNLVGQYYTDRNTTGDMLLRAKA